MTRILAAVLALLFAASVQAASTTAANAPPYAGPASITSGTINSGVSVAGSSPYSVDFGWGPATFRADNLHNYIWAYGAGTQPGGGNVCIGWLNCQSLNASGISNTAIGNGALLSATAATYVTSIGADSGHDTTTGSYNAYLGTNAAFANISGSRITALGDGALRYSTLMSGQTAVGSDACSGSNPASDSGVANTCIGRSSGYYLTTGTGYVGLGAYSGYYASDASDETKKVKADTKLTTIGYSARKSSASTLSNSTALGADAEITRSNQVTLGSSATIEVNAGGKTIPMVQDQSAVSVTGPNDTSINTVKTLTIPQNKLGPNGCARVWARFSFNNNANNKTVWAKFNGSGGSFLGGQTSASVTALSLRVHVCNVNSVSAQSGMFESSVSGQPVVSTLVSTTADTSAADTTILLQCQLATGTDTCKIEAYTFEILYGA